MSLHIFGIRHHGPGCARSLKAALDELQPDALLVEGPADAQQAIALAGDPEMKPPVALLIYPQDEPRRSVLFPLAEFSPEWQAFHWGLSRQVPVLMMDLPMQHRLALDTARSSSSGTHEPGIDDSESTQNAEDAVPDATDATSETNWRTDPLALLAEAAGYKDHELWWEEQVERRADATGLFEAILEAMKTVREEVPETRESDLLREAWMRRTIREAVKQGHQKIAVICGAWHAPVLHELAILGKQPGTSIKEDTARLKGLSKVRTTATWIPWTYSRLTYRSGYGAGMTSPGWYAHLWDYANSAPSRWVASAARLLRQKDLDASSASVIEAVRLADALAALRELRSPGLAELNEAILTVLCHGQTAPLKLIREQLEVGIELGEVPAHAPIVPLAQDLAETQKRLRFKPQVAIKLVDLDLRQESQRERSWLLHRLQILGIDWGVLQQTGGGVSTFHEIWQVEWKPEFAVSVIEASVWGNSVETASTAALLDQANKTQELTALGEALSRSILAGLESAIPAILSLIQARSAVSSDVRSLMNSLPPLAKTLRYGDVRQTKASDLEPIIIGLFERISVGLLPACSSLNDDAAEEMLKSIGHVQESLDLLQRQELIQEWQACLQSLAQSDHHGLLRGWSTRLLLEQQVLVTEELLRLTRLALSPVNKATTSAAWISGLLRGSGMLLLHQEAFWQVFNEWLTQLAGDVFQEQLPLLRRAFSDFSSSERRQMGDKVKHLILGTTGTASPGSADQAEEAIDHARAARVLPILRTILGTSRGS